MAYSEHQADRIRKSLEKANITAEKRMMGGLVFMVNGHMCVAVRIDKETGQDRLMVRVGKEKYDRLIGTRGSRTMDGAGKPMKGFLFVDPDGFDLDSDLDYWVAEALDFVNQLPPKTK